MTEQQPSVVDQLEVQAPEQLRIRTLENLKRGGVFYPDDALERLEAMGPYRAMRSNLEDYSAKIGGIRRSPELTREERLSRAADAFDAAEKAHEELSREWEATVSKIASEAESDLFAPSTKERGEYRDAALRLAGASEGQLVEAIELARLSGDSVLNKAARTIAHRQGLRQVVERSVAYDDNQTAAAYAEHARFSSEAIRESVPSMLAPYSLSEQQLASPQGLIDAHKRAKDAEEGRRQRLFRGAGQR